MQRSGAIEWIDQIKFDGWFGCNTSIVLCPVEGYTASMLNVGGPVRVCKQSWPWGMKRSCEDFRDDLFGLDIICNIALTLSVKSFKEIQRLTKSFAPRFKNRAPAKYRERLAIIVIYTVRPYIERAATN